MATPATLRGGASADAGSSSCSSWPGSHSGSSILSAPSCKCSDSLCVLPKPQRACTDPVVSRPDPERFPKPHKQQHYGRPPCLPSEQEVQVPGLSATVCTTPCTAAGDAAGEGSCPASHASASPACALQDPKTSKHFCVLTCEKDCDCPLGENCLSSVYTGPVCVPFGSTMAPQHNASQPAGSLRAWRALTSSVASRCS